MNRVLFKSESQHWETPGEVYRVLDEEFQFTLDPSCPAGGTDGLTRSWHGERVYCNLSYGRGVAAWLAKAGEARIAVFLLPARTDTRWWHEHAMRADEIRFLRGRLRFKGSSNSAPFPSVVLVFRQKGTLKS